MTTEGRMLNAIKSKLVIAENQKGFGDIMAAQACAEIADEQSIKFGTWILENMADEKGMKELLQKFKEENK